MKDNITTCTDTTAVLIPSLNPDDKLIRLIRQLRENGFQYIICVDDGSTQESKEYFQTAKKEYDCMVLTHCVNMGKGRAIKTGINYIKTELPQCLGVITVDGDGQHSIKDICNCGEELIRNKNALIMGCRNFSKEGIPFKSRFGNILTSKLIGILCGIKLSDTQTGLRGIPMECIDIFAVVSGERFEYEMNMILSAKEQNIPLVEVPIETIYIEENASSHFNPITDSIKIYAQFGKFLFSSLSSFVVDITLFSLLIHLFKNQMDQVAWYISAATVSARIFSAIYNYLLNRNKVFKSTAKINHSMLKYAILSICQCGLSALFVTGLFSLIGLNETVIKIIVDTCLFIFSFQIQREWVFRK